MILTCPQCSSRYHVDGASFPPKGRKVRCASCGHRWIAKPPADAPQPVEPATELENQEVVVPSRTSNRRVEPAGFSISPARRQPVTAKAGPIRLIVGSGFILVLLLSGVIARNTIVAGFPASAAIYQRLGLPVDVELGLEFTDVTSDWQVEGGASVLVVEGEIVNLSEGSRVIPPVRIAILDSEGRELQHDFLQIDPNVLDQGRSTAFSARLINPVEQGQNFRLTFDMNS